MADIGVASSFVGGDGRPVLEPGALFVDGNYALRLNAWSSVAGVTVALRSRFLRSADGQLVNSADQLALPTGVVLTTKDLQLSAGFPLNVEVFILSGAVVFGQCFVQVQIVGGQGGASLPLATVLQGYVSSTQALSWPGSPIQNSLDGAGLILSIASGAPGAGVDHLTFVPARVRWQLISAQSTFQASGAAANRSVSFGYTDGTNPLARTPFGSFVTAGQLLNLFWMAGLGAQVASPDLIVALPLPTNALLLATYGLVTTTGNIQAADAWGQLQLSVRQWIDV